MVTIETIGLGTAANDGTGDTARAGGTKINSNFANLKAEAERLRDRADVADPDVFFAGRPRRAADLRKGATVGYITAPITIGGAGAESFSVQVDFVTPTTLPVNGAYIFGNSSVNLFSATINANGSMTLWNNAAGLGALAVGTFVANTQYHLRIDVTQTTAVVTINGEEDSSFTFASQNWVNTVQTWGIGGYQSPAFSSECIIWDFKFTDNTTAANSRHFPLDELGGKYRDISGNNGTAATRNGLVGSVLVHDAGSGDAMLVPAIPQTRMRSAAFSNLGASGTGAFASHTLQLTGASPSFEVEMVLGSKVAPSGNCRLFGYNSVTGAPDIVIEPDGTIQFHCVGDAPTESASGAFAYDGVPRVLRVVGATSGGATLAVYLDGVLVASGVGTAWSTTSFTSLIGGTEIASGQRWPGSIHNVTYRNLLDSTKDLVYLMDELSGNYADSSGNGNGAAVRNGFVWHCAVNSTDGRGLPWTGGVTTLRYGATTGTGTYLTFSGANGILKPQSNEVDPTNSFDISTGQFTVPCDGILVQGFGGSIVATTNPAPGTNVQISARIGSGSVSLGATNSTMGVNVFQNGSFQGTPQAVLRGQLCDLYATLASASDVVLVNGEVYFLFTPTLVAG